MENLVDREWRELSARLLKYLRSGRLERAWGSAGAAIRRLAAPRGDREPEPKDLEILARLAVLAAQYGEEELASSWVSEFERASARRLSSESCDAVRLAVELASKEYARAEKRLRSIDWARVSPEPWAQNLKLLAALWARDDKLFLQTLRPRPQACASPYDRGNRFRILALWYFQRGRWARGLSCLAPALREFGRDRSVDARLREIEVRGLSGMGSYYMGSIHEAEYMLEAAIAGAEELHHTIYRDTYREQLGLLLVEKDELERAERLFASVAAEAAERARDRPADHCIQVSALLNAAGAALDREDPAGAQRYLRQARRLLEHRDHARYRGYLHLLLGRAIAKEGSRGSAARAMEHYDLAEDYFRAVGAGDLVGISAARIHRSRLHVSLRDLRAALAEAEKAAEAARRSSSPPAEAACVLLKSQLLLEQEGPRAEALYEDVLGSLGLVRNPTTLFKVIANLYLFSWELGDQLDLTAWHLGQIYSLAEVIDRATFERLYDRLIVERVLDRAVSRSFGGDFEDDR